MWRTKAAIARAAESRHLAVLAASSEEALALRNALFDRRRRQVRLLLSPTDPKDSKARDEGLDAIAEGSAGRQTNCYRCFPP